MCFLKYVCNVQHSYWKSSSFLPLNPNLLSEDRWMIFYFDQKSKATKLKFFQCEFFTPKNSQQLHHSLPFSLDSEMCLSKSDPSTGTLEPDPARVSQPTAPPTALSLQHLAWFFPQWMFPLCKRNFFCPKTNNPKHLLTLLKPTFNFSLSLVPTKASWARTALQLSDTKTNTVQSWPPPPYFSKEQSTHLIICLLSL